MHVTGGDRAPMCTWYTYYIYIYTYIHKYTYTSRHWLIGTRCKTHLKERPNICQRLQRSQAVYPDTSSIIWLPTESQLVAPPDARLTLDMVKAPNISPVQVQHPPVQRSVATWPLVSHSTLTPSSWAWINSLRSTHIEPSISHLGLPVRQGSHHEWRPRSGRHQCRCRIYGLFLRCLHSLLHATAKPRGDCHRMGFRPLDCFELLGTGENLAVFVSAGVSWQTSLFQKKVWQAAAEPMAFHLKEAQPLRQMAWTLPPCTRRWCSALEMLGGPPGCICTSACANTDNDPNGVWCFTDTACQGTNWGYCWGPTTATPTTATTATTTPKTTTTTTTTTPQHHNNHHHHNNNHHHHHNNNNKHHNNRDHSWQWTALDATEWPLQSGCLRLHHEPTLRQGRRSLVRQQSGLQVRRGWWSNNGGGRFQRGV